MMVHLSTTSSVPCNFSSAAGSHRLRTGAVLIVYQINRPRPPKHASVIFHFLSVQLVFEFPPFQFALF